MVIQVCFAVSYETDCKHVERDMSISNKKSVCFVGINGIIGAQQGTRQVVGSEGYNDNVLKERNRLSVEFATWMLAGGC